jgi:limonene-1,2-epoxide hydrolase
VNDAGKVLERAIECWRTPEAEIPATGKELDFPFVGVFRVDDGKIASIRIYYDQVEVFTQLGLMPGANAG